MKWPWIKKIFVEESDEDKLIAIVAIHEKKLSDHDNLWHKSFNHGLDIANSPHPLHYQSVGNYDRSNVLMFAEGYAYFAADCAHVDHYKPHPFNEYNYWRAR